MSSAQKPRPKRPRPVISCLECRRKKLKCDRLLPCQQCLKGGRARFCAYAEGQEPELRENIRSDIESPKRARSSHYDSDSGSGSGSNQVDALLRRLRDLEQNLHAQQTTDSIGFLHNESQQLVSTENPVNIGMSGNSLDQTSVDIEERPPLTYFPSAFQFIQSLPARNNDTTINTIASQIRAIQEVLEVPVGGNSLHREPQDIVAYMLQLLPSHEACSKLIDLYFDNFEHCHRILHRPMFLEQSNRFFLGQLTKAEHDVYVPLLIGVLSISSSLNTIPECELPLLHSNANTPGPVRLIQMWLKQLSEDDLKTINTMQARLLSLQPQKSQQQDPTKIWLASGEAIRHAMLLRYHTTPGAHIDFFSREMKCRLWLTLLEQDLALSITCNMPPNCVTFDLHYPSNVNDEDIIGNEEGNFRARPISEWTDGLCPHILAQTFNDRLKAYRLQFASRSSYRYGEVMQIANHLEQVLRGLPAPFKLDQDNAPGRLMAQMELDIILRRPLIALYAPFAMAMPADDKFRDARISWVQSNLVILCYQDLFDPKYPVIDVPRPEGYWDFYYTAYRHDIIKALYAELLELQRMKTPSHVTKEAQGNNVQQHTPSPFLRAQGWTADGMTKSIEETIDPFERRLGQDGPDFRDIVRATIVFDSLCVRSCDDSTAFLEMGLTQLNKSIRSRLERKGQYVPLLREISQNLDLPNLATIQNEDLSWLCEFLSDVDTTG